LNRYIGAAQLTALAEAAHPDVLVIRLAHVGLPLAAEAIRSGLTVAGYHLGRVVLQGLNSGYSYISHLRPTEVTATLARGSVTLLGERL